MKDAIESGAVQAWIDGKNIQYRLLDKIKWENAHLHYPEFYSDGIVWRPAPEPKLRPWRPDEVPVGAITKAHGDESSARMIVGYSEQGIFLAQDTGAYPFGDLLRFRKHSTDGGKTWHPCGVMEGGE